MVLVLTSDNNAGALVVKGLEKLNIYAVCRGDKSDIGEITQYEAMFFSGDFAISSNTRAR